MNFRIIVFACLLTAILISIAAGIPQTTLDIWSGIGIAVGIIGFFIAGYYLGRRDEAENCENKEKIYTEHL